MKTFFKSVHKNFSIVFIFMMILSLGSLNSAIAGESKKIMVFAAASTTNAVDDIGKLFSKKGYGQFVPSFASSSTLAKQIASGAPVNVYISANPKWMKFLNEQGLLEPGTRKDLLGNRIVLITPADSDLKVDIHPGFNLSKIIGNEKLAMGDPEHVPAGIYGKQALTHLGVWDEVSSKVVGAKDVRTALVFVERKEAPLGIVYATDAAITDKVRVAGIFPENSHPPVTYQVAIIKGNNTATAKAFYDFLGSQDAKAIFNKYGFFVK